MARIKEMSIVVEVDIKQKIPFGDKLASEFGDKLASEHIQDLARALSQVPRVVEFLQSGEKEVWKDLRQAGWGWIPPHNWDDLDNWDYGLCWNFLGDYVGVTITAEA